MTRNRTVYAHRIFEGSPESLNRLAAAARSRKNAQLADEERKGAVAAAAGPVRKGWFGNHYACAASGAPREQPGKHRHREAGRGKGASGGQTAAIASVASADGPKKLIATDEAGSTYVGPPPGPRKGPQQAGEPPWRRPSGHRTGESTSLDHGPTEERGKVQEADDDAELS